MNWKHARVSPSLGWWWGFWILTNILANLEMRLNFSGERDLMIAGAWLGVLDGMLSIPSALLAIKVVRDIHDRQERKAARPMESDGEAARDHVPESHRSAAETDTSQLEECPWCGRSVGRTIDGRCPACDRPI